MNQKIKFLSERTSRLSRIATQAKDHAFAAAFEGEERLFLAYEEASIITGVRAALANRYLTREREALASALK